MIRIELPTWLAVIMLVLLVILLACRLLEDLIVDLLHRKYDVDFKEKEPRKWKRK